jgi:hypothetical protein
MEKDQGRTVMRDGRIMEYKQQDKERRGESEIQTIGTHRMKKKVSIIKFMRPEEKDGDRIMG